MAAAVQNDDISPIVDDVPANDVTKKDEDTPGGGNFMSTGSVIKEGDTVIVYVTFGCAYALRAQRGHTLQMKFGALRHEYLLGRAWGSRVSATKGYVHALRPTAELWSETLPRRTQIVYPADAALIGHLLQVRPGARILEAGTGSAALTHSLARAVFPTGCVRTFDVDAERSTAARRELTEHGLGVVADPAVRDVCSEGFGVDKGWADGVFLDLPRPWEAVEAARSALRAPCGRFVAFSPCIEQTQRTAEALRRAHFHHITTVELVPRNMKVVETPKECLKAKQLPVSLEEWVRTDDCDKPPQAKKARTEGSDGRPVKETTALSALSSPVQQPTHTGYLTSATLLP